MPSRMQAQIVSHIEEAVLAADRQGHITLFNERASELFGQPADEVLGQPLSTLVREGLDQQEVIAVLRALAVSGEWEGELPIVRQDGSTRRVAAFIVPVEEDEDLQGVVAILRDVSAREQQEARIQHRLRLEGALVDASQLLVSKGEIDFEQLLGLIGRAVEADYVYLVTIPPEHQALREVGDRDQDYTAWQRGSREELTVWYRDGGQEDAQALADLETALTPKLQEILQVPEERATPRTLSEERPAAFAVPVLSSQDRLYGYLGIEQAEELRDWREEDIRVLHVLGDMLSTYFERNMAEKALRESEERWRKLVESHPEPIILTRNAKIIYINQVGAEVFGAERPDAVIGRPLFDFVSAELHDTIEQRQEALMRGEATEPLQHEIIRLDGEERIVESFAVPIVHEGRPAAQLVLRDITERKKSEERYRTFVETISEGIWHLELARPIATTTLNELQVELIQDHGLLAECNDVMAKIFGYAEPDDVIGQHLSDLLPDTSIIDDFVASGYRLHNREYSVRRSEERQQHFVINAVGTVERGQLVRVWGSCIEVTDRVELERRMVAVLEEQQQRIGRDLHDGVGQLLTGVRMLSQNLAEGFGAEEDVNFDQAQKIARYAEEASERVRDIYRGLTPVQLFQEGLAAALDELAHNTDALPNIECTFAHDDATDVYNRDVTLHLYRIAQEATNNALKHAHAAHILISLRTEGDHVVLEVEDNGIGFDPHQRNGKSLGLDSMYYRARSIGADFSIESQPEVGTVIRCMLPNTEELSHSSE